MRIENDTIHDDIYFCIFMICSFTSCCWINLVEGGGSWMMRTIVNLTNRTDSGQINSSPVSAMQPIVRFNHGCDYTLNIPGMLY